MDFSVENPNLNGEGKCKPAQYKIALNCYTNHYCELPCEDFGNCILL